MATYDIPRTDLNESNHLGGGQISPSALAELNQALTDNGIPPGGTVKVSTDASGNIPPG